MIKYKIKKILHDLTPSYFRKFFCDYQIIDPIKFDVSRFDGVWQDDNIPNIQLETMLNQLERARKTKKLPFAASTIVDFVKKTNIKNPSLLEIGCSSGYYSEFFKIADFDVKYKGCDYSGSFINLARKLYPREVFDVCDAANLPYQSNAFDIAFSAGVILHMRNYDKAVEEATRVAKKYVIIHRVPVIQKSKTIFAIKKAYNVEMLQISFNEEELLDLFFKNKLAVLSARILNENHSCLKEPIFIKSYLCQKI